MKAGFVALIGRPNAGKSTLINRLTGSDLAAVSPKAQTTRTRLTGIISDQARGQLVIVDTPGRGRFESHALSSLMAHEISDALTDIDATVLVVDPIGDDVVSVDEVLNGVPREKRLVIWLNKSDMLAQSAMTLAHTRLDPFLTDFKDVLFLEGSAKQGKGIDALLAALWDVMPEHPPYFPMTDAVSDRPTRYFVTEKIREQLFYRLRDELPYSAGVVLEKYEESDSTQRIEATIIVSRESHKGIVIGQKGQMIKAIGTQARRALEQFLGQHVFLELRVKVRPDWIHDENLVRQIAYGGTA